MACGHRITCKWQLEVADNVSVADVGLIGERGPRVRNGLKFECCCTRCTVLQAWRESAGVASTPALDKIRIPPPAPAAWHGRNGSHKNIHE